MRVVKAVGGVVAVPSLVGQRHLSRPARSGRGADGSRTCHAARRTMLALRLSGSRMTHSRSLGLHPCGALAIAARRALNRLVESQRGAQFRFAT